MEELFGSTNAAHSHQLPHLRYQYKMNEPFIGGLDATVQDSHDQARFKITEVYGLKMETTKNLDQEKQEW